MGQVMKRRIIVMRHAKSSWSSGAKSDHERPLNARGQRDAPRVGAALCERGWLPELVLSSDSCRTRETFAGLGEAFPEEVPVVWLPSFYHAGPHEVEMEVPGLDDKIGTILVLGHNPGWEHLVHTLSGQDLIMKTATAALLSRELDSWAKAFDGGRWKVEEVLYPRELE
jgi:phosphohistidine phosphatase